MKKVFKIASNNFKRLMTNPITICVLIFVFVFSLIFSAAYPIPTTESYSATVVGTSTSTMYSNFVSGSNGSDSKSDMDAIVTKVSGIIETLSTSDSEDSDKAEISTLASEFSTISAELKKYSYSPSNSSYISNGISSLTSSISNLRSFLTRFSALSAFESRVVIEKTDFAFLEEVCTQMEAITSESSSTTVILDNLLEISDDINTALDILQNKFHTFLVGSSILSDLNDALTTAEDKLDKIKTSLSALAAKATNSSDDLQTMSNTITAYKLTCESLEVAVTGELYLYFNRSYDADKFLSYESENEETIEVEISIAKYYLEDSSTTYTDSQVAMNFNIASSSVTAYDATYTTMAIIGFVCILFGIYCAYKLFGSDRKNGKMDIVLSQNVTSGQVFGGTVLSIVFCTGAILAFFTIALLLWNLAFHGTISGLILTVFNLSTTYSISPFLFLVIKVVGLELQVVFYSVLTVFLMNITRHFKISLAVSIGIFVVATILNILCNTSVIWCLFPFIHADLTSMIGGGISDAGFLQTALYSSGNFFISLAYYLVVVVLLYAFTNQLFKKN